MSTTRLRCTYAALKRSDYRCQQACNSYQLQDTGRFQQIERNDHTQRTQPGTCEVERINLWNLLIKLDKTEANRISGKEKGNNQVPRCSTWVIGLK
ncbi:MAG: hypothetical protein FE835_06325 [Gammaproteobacteria bacterium]|nr:hypothetical protein [Gammaproteobacteria bacterium]